MSIYTLTQDRLSDHASQSVPVQSTLLCIWCWGTLLGSRFMKGKVSILEVWKSSSFMTIFTKPLQGRRGVSLNRYPIIHTVSNAVICRCWLCRNIKGSTDTDFRSGTVGYELAQKPQPALLGVVSQCAVEAALPQFLLVWHMLCHT